MLADASLAEATFETRDGKTIQLRPCQTTEELDACVQLQIDTWGYADGDVIPRRVFTVARRIGGQVIAAFDFGHHAASVAPALHVVGFAMALPGIHSHKDHPPTPYLHSHMLAVRANWRNYGIGRRLKLFQRNEAISRGVSLMEWTFDPLEIKNSFLNIHRLGAIVRSYTPDFYGVSSSRLQGGLPTDRLHAEWHLRSAHVVAALSGKASKSRKIEETILVPHQMSEWKSSEEGTGLALAVQTENRERFHAAFSRGLAVTGFRTDEQQNGIFELTTFEDQQLQDSGAYEN